MIGSRLAQRLEKVTVNVTTYAGAAVYSGLTCTKTENLMQPVKTEDGVMMLDITVFFFHPATAGGTLPVIVDEHRITDTATSIAYEVVTTQHEGGQGNGLKVTTRRYT